VRVVPGAAADVDISHVLRLKTQFLEMFSLTSTAAPIFLALKASGRLVMSKPLHDNVRAATRAEQFKDHEIGPKFVEQELHAAGFEVIEQRPDSLAFTSPGHKGGFWLMIARKPAQP
jgi:hypothetical protein